MIGVVQNVRLYKTLKFEIKTDDAPIPSIHDLIDASSVFTNFDEII